MDRMSMLIRAKINLFSSYYYLFINLAIFIFAIFMLIIKSGYSIGVGLLFLLSCPVLFNKKSYQITWREGSWLFALAIYFIAHAASAFFDIEFRWRDIDLASRVFLSMTIFLLLLRFRPSFDVLVYGFATSAIFSGLLACYQKFFLGIDRALNVASNVIQSGDISMALALVCLSFTVYFYKVNDKFKLILVIIAMFMGGIGSLLSGTRGGWVMLPFILGLFYLKNRHEFSRKVVWLASLGMVVIMMLIITVPSLGVKKRLDDGINDVKLYMHGIERETSLGYRFELWESALKSYLKKPLFGWGNQGIKIAQQQQIAQGELLPSIMKFFSHAHNEYLDEMAKRGTIGLLTLLTIFFVPLQLFQRFFLVTDNAQVKIIALAGIMLVLSCMDFCLTQSFFKHNSGVMFYFPMISIFLAFCLAKPSIEQKQKKEHAILNSN